MPLPIFVADSALVILGALLEVIGFVGGQMPGIWRLGGRYHQRLLKVGAILFIVPLLGIIAPVLVIIGVSGAKKKGGQL